MEGVCPGQKRPEEEQAWGKKSPESRIGCKEVEKPPSWARGHVGHQRRLAWGSLAAQNQTEVVSLGTLLRELIQGHSSPVS